MILNLTGQKSSVFTREAFDIYIYIYIYICVCVCVCVCVCACVRVCVRAYVPFTFVFNLFVAVV